MEKVSIRIPASPAYLHVVRLVASGLAARVGFTLEDIEDLKIGVDELAAYMTGTQGRDGSLEVTFTVYDDRLEIVGRGQFPPGHKVRTDLTELSNMILATVVDSASLHRDGSFPSFSLVKTRRR